MSEPVQRPVLPRGASGEGQREQLQQPNEQEALPQNLDAEPANPVAAVEQVQQVVREPVQENVPGAAGPAAEVNISYSKLIRSSIYLAFIVVI